MLLFQGPTLTAACCMLHVACCMLHVACCMLHVERMPREVWDRFELPGLIAQEVTPYLGNAAGRVVDCHGSEVAGAAVVVRWGARQVFVAHKRTDMQGRFEFGGWVGRTTRQPHNVTVTAAGHTPAPPTVTTEVNIQRDCRQSDSPGKDTIGLAGIGNIWT